MKTDTLTTNEVAAELDINISRVKLLCREGRLGYTLPRHGFSWVITRAEIDKYRREGKRTPGPKPKKKK